MNTARCLSTGARAEAPKLEHCRWTLSALCSLLNPTFPAAMLVNSGLWRRSTSGKLHRSSSKPVTALVTRAEGPVTWGPRDGLRY